MTETPDTPIPVDTICPVTDTIQTRSENTNSNTLHARTLIKYTEWSRLLQAQADKVPKSGVETRDYDNVP